jgi:hypothetical protein
MILTIVLCSAAALAVFPQAVTVEEPSRTSHFAGYFDKPGVVAPQGRLFSFESRTPGGDSHERYTYIGRRGDKTIEIAHSAGRATMVMFSVKKDKPSEEKLSVVFEEEGVYPLPMKSLTFPNCTRKETALLKLISLKGDLLEHQIVLPDCLREAIQKKDL